MGLKIDDKELFEKIEAIRETIDRIEKKEQLAIHETIETFCTEENLRQ